jgi:hypothetical protein
MAKLRVPKPGDIDDAPHPSAERLIKATSLHIRVVEVLTPEREALERSHCMLSLHRDPLLVAMTARGLGEPELRKPVGAKKDANSRVRGRRGK